MNIKHAYAYKYMNDLKPILRNQRNLVAAHDIDCG